MSHNDLIIDSDAHFTIDAITRQIKNTASAKVTVIQYDHNSERFTFSLPRFIEGHDMLEVDKAEVHYINIAAGGSEQKAGLYEITDLRSDPEDESKVIGSWLLSQNATSLVGSLNFLLRFSCVDDEGNLEYAWNTAIFTGISVSTGMYNSEIIAEEYADVLEQWRMDIMNKISNLALPKVVDDLSTWYTLNGFNSETVKTNVIKSPYEIDDMLNNSIILSSGNIRTEGTTADKANLMSPLIEVEEGVYGLKVNTSGTSGIIGNLGNDNNGYGLFAQDGVTPVAKVSMVNKGNNIYLITVPADAKYIRFVIKKGANNDTNLYKALEAFNTWVLLPDATDDITDDFFIISENVGIDKIYRNDGSYLDIVDAEAREKITSMQESLGTVTDVPLTFGRRTCAIFKKVCCIGDSYTAGYIMNSNGTPISNNDYSWVEHIKNITGRDYVNCGISGTSTRTWLTDERGLAKAQIPENKSQAYLIGLQINDASTSMHSYTPVGSVEDIGTDAETYYGCMSKIVNEIFAINPLAHVFIQTQPKNYTGVHTPYRQAVLDIVAYFQNDGVHTNQVHLIDLLEYYKLYQNAGCNDSMVNGHFTAVGWEYCAEILAYAWSNYINQNPLKFQDVNLIPYGEAENVLVNE